MFHIKIMDHQTNIYDSNNQNYSAAFEELWSESHEPNETEFMMDDLSYYQSPPQAHSAIEPQQLHIERGLAMQKYRLERLQSRGPDYSRSGSLLETVLRHGRNGVTKNYMTMDQARNNINANYNINPTSNLDINSPPYSPECKKSPQSLLPQYFSAQPQTLQNPNIVYGQQQQQPDCHYALNQPPPSMCSTMNANNIISIDTYQSVNTGYNVTSDSKHTVNSDVKPILNTSNSTARNNLEYQWMQSNGTGDGARKRTRQTYSSFQTMELEKEFRDSEYLTKMRRDIVAKKVQLTDRQVKIWYQNRRMKAKKEAKSGFGIIRLSDDKTKIIPLDTNQMSPNNWARIPDADPTSSHVTAPMLQIAESTSMPSQEMMSSENQVQMCQHYDIPEQYTYDLGQAEYLPDKCQRS